MRTAVRGVTADLCRVPVFIYFVITCIRTYTIYCYTDQKNNNSNTNCCTYSGIRRRLTKDDFFFLFFSLLRHPRDDYKRVHDGMCHCTRDTAAR